MRSIQQAKAKVNSVTDTGKNQFNDDILKWLVRCDSALGTNSTFTLGTPKNKFSFANTRAPYRIIKVHIPNTFVAPHPI